MGRLDETGRAYAGSQRQIQSYVNEASLRPSLDDALRREFSTLDDEDIEWRAPLRETRYAEPKDDSFWPAIDRPDLREECGEWWPRGGPQWDAVALGRADDRDPTVVLVEAKANVAELSGGDMSATDPRSVALIDAALRATIERLGATADLSRWKSSYYQLANRLAWTVWLRQHDVDALFAHVLFEGDSSNISDSADELQSAVDAAHLWLGLADMPEWAATIVLPAAPEAFESPRRLAQG